MGAWERGPVDVLAVLPDVTQNVQSSVEGLTVGPDGNIYVPTFGFNTEGSLTGNAVLFVISPSGNIVRKLTIQGSSPHMLGLAFNPVFGNLLVLDFGAGTVLDVNPFSGESTVKAGPIANSGLNALTFDQSGNAYVSVSYTHLGHADHALIHQRDDRARLVIQRRLLQKERSGADRRQRIAQVVAEYGDELVAHLGCGAGIEEIGFRRGQAPAGIEVKGDQFGRCV